MTKFASLKVTGKILPALLLICFTASEAKKEIAQPLAFDIEMLHNFKQDFLHLNKKLAQADEKSEGFPTKADEFFTYTDAFLQGFKSNEVLPSAQNCSKYLRKSILVYNDPIIISVRHIIRNRIYAIINKPKRQHIFI